jgi:hypothetical protein
MKRFFYISLILFTSVKSFGQTMQASMGAGSSSTRVILYVRPTAPVNGTISTLQFSVAIDALLTPAPTVSIVGTPAFGVTWNIDPSYVEAGYRIYDFTTAASPSVTIASGTETQVMEIEFIGGPTIANNVLLLTLPAGGLTTGNTLFFCSGAATSIEGQLYYARAGTTVVNNLSYTGALNSTATLAGVVLPVNWLSFDVVKQGKDAVLNWAVANEDANHHYELQRSSNGTNFTSIATISKSANGSTSYNYTDLNITNLGATVLYYRIKQVDINGRITYSDIRTLRLDIKGNQISIFPNPVTEGFYVNIPFVNADNRPVKLHLIAANGQVVAVKQITAAMASNYYFDIKNKALAAGSYNLQIIAEDKIVETKRLNINQ